MHRMEEKVIVLQQKLPANSYQVKNYTQTLHRASFQCEIKASERQDKKNDNDVILL